MIQPPPLKPFVPNPPDAAGVVSWIHIGDLHMTEAGEQNHRDLLSIVEEVNRSFAPSIAFVFLPGDVADHGSVAEYSIVRNALDRLTAPWCSIIGDHDVHEKNYSNFLGFMSHATHYSFQVGSVHFFALNAFGIPDPRSFCVDADQLAWLRQEISSFGKGAGDIVFLLHCYPSDLKQGGDQLRKIVQESGVRLIDMGHTHYNEVANDGRTLYTATRSTGQIEEGAVGFSVTNIDGTVVSWKFLPLGELPAIMITSPADRRFIADTTPAHQNASGPIQVRAKAWGDSPIQGVIAKLGNRTVQLSRIPDSNIWQGELQHDRKLDGVDHLQVIAEDRRGRFAEDTIRMVVGASSPTHPPQRAARDQDNAIEAWPQRGLLGTQLGPNKNGKKW